MEHKRIQKLLLSEYKDFNDTILLESPFAETTRDGDGLREVALGITPTTLIIATDVLKDNAKYFCPSYIDPSIETLELLSIHHLDDVTLSVFCRKRRKTLKARLNDGRINYYELGGMDRRELYWNMWCDKVQILLSKKQNGSSLSEATAASSSSTSTLYFLSSDVDMEDGVATNKKVMYTLTDYIGAGDGTSPSWIKKDVYLGPSYNELGPKHYTPIPLRFHDTSTEQLRNVLTTSTREMPKKSHRNQIKKHSKRKNRDVDDNSGLCDVIYSRESSKRLLERGCGDSIQQSRRVRILENTPKYSTEKNQSQILNKSERTLIPKLSRFAFGIEEKCSSGLYLPVLTKRARTSRTLTMDYHELIEYGCTIWERNNAQRNSGIRGRTKNLRRYGLATAPHFLAAFGPWPIQLGDRMSIHSRRSASVVTIRRPPMDPELQLPVPRKQLATSVSMTALQSGMSTLRSTRVQVVKFWTPDYWYRPRAATAVYQELRRHLNLLREYQLDKNKLSQRKFFSRKYSGLSYDDKLKVSERQSILSKIFPTKQSKKRLLKNDNDKFINDFRRSLKMNLRITAWDLDSTTVAKQLTLIDRDLFLRIPVTEMEMMIVQKSTRNTPNIGAWIAFSHRISCLVASEILAINKLDMRTRIIVRFINIANKCYNAGNFHSCRSILAGLQSPPIYRLRSTWSYLKIHHTTRYELMSRLCKIFRNPRTKAYKRAWMTAERVPPVLPYIGDIVVRVLELNNSKASDQSIIPQRRKSRTIYTQWDSGSTYLTQAYNGRDSSNTLIESISEQSDSKWSFRQKVIQKFFSIALIRLRHGKSYTTIVNPRKDVFWAGRQLILARKYYDCWRTFVITAKIIMENKKKKEMIDFEKKQIRILTNWLTDCQRHVQSYDYPVHSLAREFLLKARYREDRENFVISRKLEKSI